MKEVDAAISLEIIGEYNLYVIGVNCPRKDEK